MKLRCTLCVAISSLSFLMAASPVKAATVDSGALRLSLSTINGSYLGVLSEVLGGVCYVQPFGAGREAPRLVVTNDGGDTHGNGGLVLRVLGPATTLVGMTTAVKVRPLAFDLFSADLLTTSCGDWRYEVRLRDELQPESELHLVAAADSSAQGLFIGRIRLEAVLILTKANSAQMVVEPLSLDLDLGGPWVLFGTAPSVPGSFPWLRTNLGLLVARDANSWWHHGGCASETHPGGRYCFDAALVPGTGTLPGKGSDRIQ